MIIPKIGDWLTLRTDFGESEPGKVNRIDLEKKIGRGDFFTESDSKENEGGTEEVELYFEETKEIIKSQRMIDDFEKELAGK